MSAEKEDLIWSLKMLGASLLIVIIVFLMGCQPQERGDSDHVAVVGASLCVDVWDDGLDVFYTWAELGGFQTYCRGGLKATDISWMPQGYPVTILNLGDNDAFYQVPINEFRDHYQDLVDQVDGELWCVLPLQVSDPSGQYRSAIGDICSNTIDLWQCGWRSRADDGIHGNWKDHQDVYYKCFKHF